MIGTRQYAVLAVGRRPIEVGDRVRIVAGVERGVSAEVVSIVGPNVIVLTRNGRTLAYDRAELAPIAVAIAPGR